MKRRSIHVCAGVLLSFALTACGDRTPTPTPAQAETAPVTDQPSEDVPPATAPTPLAPAGSGGPARMDGYADLRLGGDAADARKALGGDVAGKAQEPGGCYYLSSASRPELPGLMIEGEKLVRYDVGEGEAIVAPGGGKVGMGADELRALYAGRIETQPHKYVQGGEYWRIKDAAGAGVLVFELVDGKVSLWRVGLPPQVDYVEGCS